MSPIWSSSERPISVRTVWVDGVRHAILTSDDPILALKARQRPQTSTPPKKPKSYQTKYVCREGIRCPEGLDSCFVNFHVVVNKRDAEVERKHVARRQSAPINRIETARSLNLELNGIPRIRNNNETSDEAKMDSRRSVRDNFIKNREDSHYDRIDEDFGKNCVKFSHSFENDCDTKGNNPNPLSERVLQWMDMSGRVKNHDEKDGINNRNRMNNRRSSVRTKVCSFRRQNSVLSQDLVTVQHDKFTVEKPEGFITDIDTENDQNLMDEPRGDVFKGKSNNSKCDNSSHSGKSVWSPMGRQQLHIFMPDLNSSGEDTSSQDSLRLDESPEQTDVN